MNPTVVRRGRRSAPRFAPITCIMATTAALTALASAGVENDFLPENGIFCSASNWTLNQVPGTAHDAFLGRVGDPNPTATLNCNRTIGSLTLLNNSTFRNAGFQLTALDNINIGEHCSVIITPWLADPLSPGLFARQLRLVSDNSELQLLGGRIEIDEQLFIGYGLIHGHGEINITDPSHHAAVINNGLIFASGGDLTFNLAGDAYYMLDTSSISKIATIDYDSDVTFNGNMPGPSNPFSGEIDLRHGNRMSVSDTFYVDGLMKLHSDVEQPTSFVSPGLDFVLGGTLHGRGGPTVINGPYVNWRTGSSLQVDAGTLMMLFTDAMLLENSSATVNGTLRIYSDATYHNAQVSGAGYVRHDSDIDITGDLSVTMPNGVFDLDGMTDDATVTLASGTSMHVTAASIDSNTGNTFDGLMHLNGEAVITLPQPWTHAGTIIINDLPGGVGSLGGSPVTFADGSLLHVVDDGAEINSLLTVEDGAQLSADADGRINLLNSSTWRGGNVSGEGQLRPHAAMHFESGHTTIDIARFDWDNASSVIASDAELTIRSQQYANDNIAGHQGQLTVQGTLHMDRGKAWLMAGQLHLTRGEITGDALHMTESGSMFVHGAGGQSEINAPLELAGGPSINVSAGATVELNGPTTLNGSSLVTPVITGPGSVVQNGDLHVQGNSLITAGLYDLDGNGDQPASCTIDAFRALYLDVTSINSQGSNDYHGTLTIGIGGILKMLTGQLSMHGDVIMHSDPQIEAYAHVQCSGMYLHGSAQGSGMFEGTVVQTGTISPGIGDDYGRMLIYNGLLAQSSTAVTHVKIGGGSPGVSHDQVYLFGSGPISAQLNGTLVVERAEGYTPHLGQSFSIMEAPYILGTFLAIDAPGFEITIEQNTAPFADRVVATFVGTGCAGDIAPLGGDGVVNVGDMLIMLNQWGQCTSPCSADLNGDGIVNVGDLLMLLANWGSCQ